MNTNTVLSTDIATALHSNIRFKNVLDLVIRQDRPVALAALRSAASSLQFNMFSTADWILRNQEAKERLNEFLGTDLDQRNTQDEHDRGKDAHDQAVSDMGHEVPMDPNDKLKLVTGLYDAIIREIGKLDPTVFDLPRRLDEALDQFILTNGSGQSASEATLLALKAAGINDQEFADAGMEAGRKRMARLRGRRDEILTLINEQGTGDLDQMLQLPIHTQLRMATGMWKGVFSRRRQIVQYIASSGKLEQLSDLVLLKNGLKAIEEWCTDFEDDNKIVLEALIDAGVGVVGIGDAIEWSRTPRK